MTESKIFRLEDGSTWHFDAPTQEACRAQWVQACIEMHGYRDEAHIIDEFGEPEIEFIPMLQAMKIMVTDDENTVPCDRCGNGRLPRKVPLLDWWRENRQKPPEKRAKWGALCNSEWP